MEDDVRQAPHPTLSDLVIRRAEASDLPAIVDLLADDPLGAAREAPGSPLVPQYAAAFAEMNEQGGNELLIATLAHEVIACLQLTVIAGVSRLGMRRAQIEGVRVSRVHRGRGIGERLVSNAIERARGQGCGLVQLTTDRSRPDAQQFYEGLGFVPSHVGMKLEL